MAWTAEDERKWKLDWTARYLPGWMQDWYYNPCLPTPSMFIKATFLATARLGLELFPIDEIGKVDKKEVIHYATGKTWLKHTKQVIEDVEVRDAEWIAATKEGTWAFFEVVDQLIWRAFVGDMINETMANWTSMVFTLSGCQRAPGHLVGQSSTPFGVGYVGKDKFYDMGEFVECSGDFGDHWTPSLIPEPGGYASITCTVKATTVLGAQPLPIDVAICDIDTGAAYFVSEWGGILGQPEFGNFAIVKNVYRPPGTAKGIVARIRLNESWPEDTAEFVLTHGHCTLDQLPAIHQT